MPGTKTVRYQFPISGSEDGAKELVKSALREGYGIFTYKGKRILLTHAGATGEICDQGKDFLSCVDAVICCSPSKANTWLQRNGYSCRALGTWKTSTLCLVENGMLLVFETDHPNE